LTVFGHEIDDEEGDIESKYSIVPVVCQFHPRVDVLDRTAEGCQRGQCQRDRITGIAKA
jgi:hypothetical protein